MTVKKSELGRASDNDALQLVVAFYCIMEPEKRAEVVALAEEYARKSAVVDGVTHFLLLASAEFSLKA
jgi:hypothetical protein